MADLWAEFDQQQTKATKPKADDLWAEFDGLAPRPAIPNAPLGQVTDLEPVVSRPDFSNVQSTVSTVPAPAKEPSLLDRAANFVSSSPQAAVVRGLSRAGLGDAFQLGDVSTVASAWHTITDTLDQLAQKPMRDLSEAVGARDYRGINPFADPLGLKEQADSSLDVVRQVRADQQAGAQEIGGRPSLDDFLANPSAAIEQATAYYSNQGVQSVPAILLALASRNPEVGGLIMGGTTGSQTFADLRADGIDRRTAGMAGAASGLIEASLGRTGLEAATAPGVRALLTGPLVEAGTEAVTALGQSDVEDFARGKQTPFLDKLSEAFDSAVLGAGFGVGEKAASSAFDLADSRQPAAAPRPSVQPTPQPDPTNLGDASTAPEDTSDLDALLTRNLPPEVVEAARAALGDPAEAPTTPAPVLDTARIAEVLGNLLEPAPSPASPAVEPPSLAAAQTSPVQPDTPPTRDAAEPDARPAPAESRGRQRVAPSAPTPTPEQSGQVPAGQSAPVPAGTDLGDAAIPREVPAPVERRADALEVSRLNELRALRKQGAMAPEQQNELLDLTDRDRLTGKVAGRRMRGVLNMEARVELEDAGRLKPVQAFADADNFKAVNDRLGHEVGDHVIRQMGELFAEELGEGNVFHRGGDEFVMQGDSPEQVNAALEAVRDRLAGATFRVTLENGEIVEQQGVRFSYGAGRNIKEAENAQRADKEARKRAGLRTDRDEQPATDSIGSDRASGARGEEAGQGRVDRATAQEVSGGLFGAPTARDFIDARQRQRDDERNGKAGTGRTDIAAGDGELFAGPRPEQARVDEPLESLNDAQELSESDLTPTERAIFQSQREDAQASKAKREIAEKLSREQGEADADASGLREAVDAAVGKAKIRPVYLRGEEGLPQGVRDMLAARRGQRDVSRGSKGRTAGLYVPGATPTVYLFTDVLASPELAAFTAAHEIAGHTGLRAMLGDQLNNALQIAEQNPTVKAVADSMARQRKSGDRMLMIEEALADLAAAQRTGNWQRIKTKHGVDVPLSMRSKLAAAIDNFLRRLKALFAKQGTAFTDAQVRQLLENAWQAAKGETAIGEPEALESVEEAEGRAESRREKAAQTLPVSRGTPGWSYDDGVWKGVAGQARIERANLQDKMLAFRDAQNQLEAAGRVVDDASNVYRLENLMHGRVGEGISRVEREQVEPLLKAMKAAKVSPAQLEEYLYALYAKDRNAQIAEKNQAMPDGGSGMTNAEADAILAQPDAAKLDPLVRQVRGIINATRKRMLQHGLITPEAYAAMREDENYVPLRGKAANDFTPDLRGSGRGLDSRQQLVKTALGRGAGNRAQNVLGEIIGDAQRSIILAEKARVGRGLMRLVLANPNPDLWNVEPVQTERALDANGEVYERVINDWSDPSIVAVRHKGQLFKVELKNPQLAKAFNHVGVEQMNGLFRAAGAVNRYFSAVLTKYNPGFVPVNATRDALFGLTGLAVDHGEAVALDAALHYPQAITAATAHAAGKTLPGNWGRWANEFAAAGGKTGYVNMPSVEELTRNVANVTMGGPVQNLKRAAKSVADLVGVLNDGVENALRLSAYATLRKRGMSSDQAAAYAKDMTVNFNRKGFDGSKINAWFLFYNAGLQGAHRTSKLLRNPKTYAYLGALAAIQAVATMAAMGMEDEEGEPLWNKIPDHVKRRNLVIVLPPKPDEEARSNGVPDAMKPATIVTVPMPYGFNLFPYLAGRLVSEVTNRERGDKSQTAGAAKITADVMSATAESFFPVPIGDGAMGLMPTALRIPANLQNNKDDFGRPIHRDSIGKSDVPLASMGKPDTLEVFKLTAEGLNRLGGGDEYTPPPMKALDVAPEDLEYLVKELTGGTGQFVVELATVGQKATGGKEFAQDIRPRDVPIARRFVSNIDEQAAQTAMFYDRREVIDRSLKRVKQAFKRDGEDAAQALLDTMPELTGATFRRRKRDSDNGPAGSVILVDGAPQIVAAEADSRAKPSVFAAFKRAEKAVDAHRDTVESAFLSAPASIFPSKETRLRDKLLRDVSQELTGEQAVFNEAWVRDVVGAADNESRGAGVGAAEPGQLHHASLPESRRAEYVGWNENSRVTPAPDVLRGAKNAPKLVMVGSTEHLPEFVREAFDEGSTGLYVAGENRVYVAMGMDEAETKFTAYHEMAGHYGLQGALGERYRSVLEHARENPTVAAIARSKLGEKHRGPIPVGMVDEALAELAAARRTGDYARVERDWGVNIPEAAKPGLKGMLSRVGQMTKRTLADLTGEPPEAFDDDQVWELIEDAWQYVEGG